MLAASTGNTEAVLALIHAGAKLDAKNQYGETALMFAAENGHIEVVRALLEARASAPAEPGAQKTINMAFMLAAARGHTETVQLLLTAGAISQRRFQLMKHACLGKDQEELKQRRSSLLIMLLAQQLSCLRQAQQKNLTPC